VIAGDVAAAQGGKADRPDRALAGDAVAAALWTAGKPAGRYDMRAVLGL